MEIGKELAAPCGLYCGVCGIFIAHKNNDQKFKARLCTVYGLKLEDIHCEGCLAEDEEKVFFYCRICPIKSCSRERKYKGCYQCQDFPCEHIENFPMPVGKKVIMRAIPYWRQMGTEKWIQDEEARYVCPECGHKLFRGAKKCNKCKKDVHLD